MANTIQTNALKDLDIVILFAHESEEVDLARSHLLEAFDVLGVPPRWREIDLSRPATPNYWKNHAALSILIREDAVEGKKLTPNAKCSRLYYTEDGSLSCVPSVQQIAAKLRTVLANTKATNTEHSAIHSTVDWQRMAAMASELAAAQTRRLRGLIGHPRLSQ